MPQLTRVRLCVGGNTDFPNVVSLHRRHSMICRAFIIRGSANYRNRDAAQGGLGRRGQEVLLPRMLFLVEKAKE